MEGLGNHETRISDFQNRITNLETLNIQNSAKPEKEELKQETIVNVLVRIELIENELRSLKNVPTLSPLRGNLKAGPASHRNNRKPEIVNYTEGD